ncbi:hypothetical protein ANN_15014 [Periplaneta americana]|uniref:Uncharacterized protein n=1 Tax=Periplaneta americana TaxID=6978 RepID=A0ABQ8SYI3_PERAM|nr:hypothetical protein ANN_15014 [Periplaneta americana]
MLRKTFGANRDEVRREWRKLHNAELQALYSSPDIIRNIKSRRLRWAGHVAHMDESRNAYRVLVGRPEGRRPLGWARRRSEENIKMYLNGGEWRKLHNAELHALYSSPDIIRNIKSRRLRWAGHVAHMDESRNAYRVLVGRPEGRRPLGWARRRSEDNIKMYLNGGSPDNISHTQHSLLDNHGCVLIPQDFLKSTWNTSVADAAVAISTVGYNEIEYIARRLLVGRMPAEYKASRFSKPLTSSGSDVYLQRIELSGAKGDLYHSYHKFRTGKKEEGEDEEEEKEAGAPRMKRQREQGKYKENEGKTRRTKEIDGEEGNRRKGGQDEEGKDNENKGNTKRIREGLGEQWK